MNVKLFGMDQREGPTRYTPPTRLTCCGCKHHKEQMVKSGLNPVYRSYCMHPKRWGDAPTMGDIEREIGDTDDTPHWCPVPTGRSSNG